MQTHIVGGSAEPSALQFVALYSRSTGEPIIAGIAVLRATDATKLAEASLIETLASALLEYDDVDPATCII